jgi:cytochrome subunit of sulfide dehydrogenase
VATTAASRRQRRGRTEEIITVRSISIVVAAIALAAAGTAAAQGGDPNAGRSLAATCANCHGTNGTSAGGTENLAGQAKADLVRKMQEFRSGAKPGTIMPQLAKGYTEAQIDQVAEYFAAQKVAK